MRCPRTDFRCCAVFSAGSNPDFDLCATVRDFHPCFPRPTDWLKCEKELFEKFDHSKSALALRIGALVGMYPHIWICRYVLSIQKTHCRMFLGGHCSVTSVDPWDETRETHLALNQREQASMPICLTNSTHAWLGKKMPTRNRGSGRFVGTFCQSFSFFLLKRLGTGVASLSSAVKRPMDWVTTNKSL